MKGNRAFELQSFAETPLGVLQTQSSIIADSSITIDVLLLTVAESLPLTLLLDTIKTMDKV
ncbi:hypothetical protein TIFTF001_039381 [Ficus carica]|uniref:Uncharacterized protein n=1 Tax=Ficus carica TaxID=3494 RepID=A0AA88E920_FICCA|nr:hypothetical protein TIFTF001_039381 [Ficus carica]